MSAQGVQANMWLEDARGRRCSETARVTLLAGKLSVPEGLSVSEEMPEGVLLELHLAASVTFAKLSGISVRFALRLLDPWRMTVRGEIDHATHDTTSVTIMNDGSILTFRP